MGKSLAQVHIIQVGKLRGTPAFGRKLIEALQRLDRFEFTEDSHGADAVLEAHGTDTEDGFVGDASLKSPQGVVLWTGHAVRPHGVAGPMAYERLVEQLRAELQSIDHSTS